MHFTVEHESAGHFPCPLKEISECNGADSAAATPDPALPRCATTYGVSIDRKVHSVYDAAHALPNGPSGPADSAPCLQLLVFILQRLNLRLKTKAHSAQLVLKPSACPRCFIILSPYSCMCHCWLGDVVHAAIPIAMLLVSSLLVTPPEQPNHQLYLLKPIGAPGSFGHAAASCPQRPKQREPAAPSAASSKASILLTP